MKDHLETLQSPITTLELPTRLEIALYRAGLKTVGDVVALTLRQIAALPNVGGKSVKHLTLSLRARDLCLTGEKPPKIDQTTPPQVGAPDTEAESGSVAPATTHVATVVHKKATRCYCMASARVYAVVVVPRPGGSRILLVEVVGERIITCQQVPPCVREFATRSPRHVGLIYVGVEIRSFLGLVNTFVPVFTVDVSDREMWSAEDVTSVMSPQLTKHIMDALFN